MGSSSDNQRQQILLITGMSGAGKTTALRVLEDLGCFAAASPVMDAQRG